MINIIVKYLVKPLVAWFTQEEIVIQGKKLYKILRNLDLGTTNRRVVKKIATILATNIDKPTIEIERKIRDEYVKIDEVSEYRKLKPQLDKQIKKLKQEKKDATWRPFKQFGWIEASRHRKGSTTTDLKIGGKTYTGFPINDNMLGRMRTAKSVGKWLWNTIWLFKRTMTKKTHYGAIQERLSPEVKYFTDRLSFNIRKSGILPKYATRSVSATIKNNRISKKFPI